MTGPIFIAGGRVTSPSATVPPVRAFAVEVALRPSWVLICVPNRGSGLSGRCSEPALLSVCDAVLSQEQAKISCFMPSQ